MISAGAQELIDLNIDLVRAQRRVEKANAEARIAAQRLQEAMRRFAEAHPAVRVVRHE